MRVIYCLQKLIHLPLHVSQPIRRSFLVLFNLCNTSKSHCKLRSSINSRFLALFRSFNTLLLRALDLIPPPIEHSHTFFYNSRPFLASSHYSNDSCRSFCLFDIHKLSFKLFHLFREARYTLFLKHRRFTVALELVALWKKFYERRRWWRTQAVLDPTNCSSTFGGPQAFRCDRFWLRRFGRFFLHSAYATTPAQPLFSSVDHTARSTRYYWALTMTVLFSVLLALHLVICNSLHKTKSAVPRPPQRLASFPQNSSHYDVNCLVRWSREPIQNLRRAVPLLSLLADTIWHYRLRADPRAHHYPLRLHGHNNFPSARCNSFLLLETTPTRWYANEDSLLSATTCWPSSHIPRRRTSNDTRHSRQLNDLTNRCRRRLPFIFAGILNLL